MVSALVGEWLAVAMEQKVRMNEKTRGLQKSMKRELAYRQRVNVNGFFTRRLANCLSALRQRCSTLIVAGWNNGKFDNACLVSNGLYVALQSLFGVNNVNIVKKDTSLILISAWNPEEEIGLRIVDALLFHSPCSLETYLESHKSQLPPGTLTKGTFPFHAMGKCLDAAGQDAGYQIVYSDFYDPVRDRNALDYPHQVFQCLLEEEEGNVEKALRRGGWATPPLPGPQVFQELSTTWTRQGLRTGFRVLADYMLRDVIPLLHLTMRKSQLILETTGKNMFHEFLSISSFTFNWLLSSSAENGVHFHALGSRITQLMREHVTGGLSWVSHRFVEAGMRIPGPRLLPPSEVEEEAAAAAPYGYGHTFQAAEETESGLEMEQGVCTRSLDANSLYGSTMRSGEMLHGHAVTRPKSNAYRGLLDDDTRSTTCAQALAYLSKVEKCFIASEFTTGEQYVVVRSEKWAAEIEEIWRSTIGEYLTAEREWRKRQPKGGRVAGEEDLAATEIQDALDHSDDESEDEEGMEVEQEDGAESEEEEEDESVFRHGEGTDEPGRSGQLRGAQTLARLLQRLPSPGPLTLMSKASSRRARRRISSSSSSSDSTESSPQGVMGQGPRSARDIPDEREKPAFTPKFKLRKDNYRWRVDGLIKAETVDDRSGEEDEACLDEMSLLFRSVMQMEREKGEQAEQELAREREDALGQSEPDRTLSPTISLSPSSARLHTSIHPRPSKGTVIEINTCGANHSLCACGCALRKRLEREPELIFRQRYFSRTLGRMFAEDEFRTAVISLEYDMRVIWTCQWTKMREERGSAVAAFCSSFTLSGRTFPLDKGFTEEEMLQAIRDERIHGLVQADILIPPAVRLP